MSTVCAFSARRVRITSDTFIDSNSSLQFTTQPVAERISPSVNNVRFACAGFASRPGLPGFIESVILEITTKATFRFEPAEPSRFIANAHFVPLGTVSLTARAGGFLQSAGSAHFFLSGRVSTRVRAASGETVFRFVSDFETLFDFHAQGGDVAETTSEIVSSELGSLFLSTPTSPVILPSDVVFVRADYRVLVFADNGAEFLLDFATGQGIGLNVPMIAVNFFS